MARYVAFLRGINLGSTHKVSMPRLRELAEGLGYTDVVTYINSGNLVLTATDAAATIEQRLTKAIADELGLKVDVAVRTPTRLATIVAQNPKHHAARTQRRRSRRRTSATTKIGARRSNGQPLSQERISRGSTRRASRGSWVPR